MNKRGIALPEGTTIALVLKDTAISVATVGGKVEPSTSQFAQ